METKIRVLLFCSFSCFLILSLTSCSHQLTIKNSDLYCVPTKMCVVDQKPIVAVLPFSGQPDDLFYFNTLINRLSLSPNIQQLYTDYVPIRQSNGSHPPDLVFSIKPKVKYESSGWNFLINWPGFLIFTPSWNGYIYKADIITRIEIQGKDGQTIHQLEIPISYDIRQAEFDRTVFTGITWLEVGLFAFGGGIYNANVFDRDIIPTLQLSIKDTYSDYVGNEVVSKLCAASRTVEK